MTKQPKKPVEPMYFLFSEKSEGEYYHVNVRVVRRENESPRNFYSGDTAYADLRLTCQGDGRSLVRADEREPVYGWEYEWDVSRVRPNDLPRMLKISRQIDAGLAKMQAIEGRPLSFGQFVGQIGRVLKIAGGLTRKDERAHTWDYTEQDFRWFSLGETVSNIDWMIQKKVAAARTAAGVAQ